MGEAIADTPPCSLARAKAIFLDLRLALLVSVVMLVVVALAGCTTTAPVEDPRQVWCDFNDPRRDATPETPRAELDEINVHNAKGILWCQWAP